MGTGLFGQTEGNAFPVHEGIHMRYGFFAINKIFYIDGKFAHT